MGKGLFLQCQTGISGDMFLGGAAELGLDLAELEGILREAGLEVGLGLRRIVRSGIEGGKLEIGQERSPQLRHLPQIEAILDRMPVSEGVREKSRGAFWRLAKAEARVHGIQPETVHFHEVGAVDTIVDVVGAFWALERLGVDRVDSSELPWFQGSVRCEHGLLPLPAPATVELLQGKPVYPSDYQQEIITPTGALILDQTADSFGRGFCGNLLLSAVGWGSMELEGLPNGLRMFLYQGPEAASERITVLESAVDHLTGEELGDLYQELLRAGAADLIYLPGVMKKNRPGGLLQVLVLPESEPEVARAFFRYSLTLGIRRREMERLVAPRRRSRMSTPWGELEAKEIDLARGVRVKRPEFEELRRVARQTGYSPAQLRLLLQEGQSGS